MAWVVDSILERISPRRPSGGAGSLLTPSGPSPYSGPLNADTLGHILSYCDLYTQCRTSIVDQYFFTSGFVWNHIDLIHIRSGSPEYHQPNWASLAQVLERVGCGVHKLHWTVQSRVVQDPPLLALISLLAPKLLEFKLLSPQVHISFPPAWLEMFEHRFDFGKLAVLELDPDLPSLSPVLNSRILPSLRSLHLTIHPYQTATGLHSFVRMYHDLADRLFHLEILSLEFIISTQVNAGDCACVAEWLQNLTRRCSKTLRVLELNDKANAPKESELISQILGVALGDPFAWDSLEQFFLSRFAVPISVLRIHKEPIFDILFDNYYEVDIRTVESLFRAKIAAEAPNWKRIARAPRDLLLSISRNRQQTENTALMFRWALSALEDIWPRLAEHSFLATKAALEVVLLATGKMLHSHMEFAKIEILPIVRRFLVLCRESYVEPEEPTIFAMALRLRNSYGVPALLADFLSDPAWCQKFSADFDLNAHQFGFELLELGMYDCVLGLLGNPKFLLNQRNDNGLTWAQRFLVEPLDSCEALARGALLLAQRLNSDSVSIEDRKEILLRNGSLKDVVGYCHCGHIDPAQFTLHLSEDVLLAANLEAS